MASTPASVSALLKPRKSTERNAFPLDHRQVYSIKAGQITPVKCMKFVPNDHFSIEVGEFCITFPMQTAPFLRGRKETVFYSVYNSAIWSLFNQYIGQRSDPKTSALNTKLMEPRIALWDLYRFALSQFVYYLNFKIYSEASVRSSQAGQSVSEDKIQYLININRESFLNAEFIADNAFNPFLDGFAVSFTGVPNTVMKTLPFTPNQVNPNDPTHSLNRNFCQDIVGQYRVYNVLRKLDMLGYGNLIPLFREVEQTMDAWLSDITDWAGATVLSSFAADCSTLLDTLAFRLFQMSFTYDTSGSTIVADSVIPKYVNLYAICAYNLIFYHFFRNSFYDLNYNPRDYNLDYVSAWSNDGDNDFNVVDITDFSCRFLDIEYHQWKKDQFTGVLPDTQFGAVSSLTLTSVTGSDQGRWSNDRGTAISPNGNIRASYGGTNLNDQTTNYDVLHTHEVVSSFDVIALKRAEILQDYRQTLMRAGNKTSDIFNALYGGSPSSEHEDDIIPRFIETFGEDVFVDPVTATANTEAGSNGTLGDLSARGKFSGSSKKFSFNAGHNFGVVLCLTYFVPSSEYNSYFLDPCNSCLNPEDHYVTQFENLGLEPIYSDELNNLVPRNQLSVLGYAPRYHYLKSQVDVVHGEFVSVPETFKLLKPNGSGSVFSRGRISSLGFQGMFNIWVAPRTDLQNRYNTQLRDFYINPSILDNIFVQSADATQGSDSLICNTYLDWQATRGMSKVGLMNFV